jgi:hypothetical protein
MKVETSTKVKITQKETIFGLIAVAFIVGVVFTTVQKSLD